MSLSYNQRSTSLRRSESQRCLHYDGYPPRKRSVSTYCVIRTILTTNKKLLYW